MCESPIWPPDTNKIGIWKQQALLRPFQTSNYLLCVKSSRDSHDMYANGQAVYFIIQDSDNNWVDID